MKHTNKYSEVVNVGRWTCDDTSENYFHKQEKGSDSDTTEARINHLMLNFKNIV